MRIVWLVVAALALAILPAAAQEDPCWPCHASTTPGIVEQWKESKHFEAEIGCLDCHAAEEGEADAFRHHGKMIAIIVSPLDCSSCHEQEYIEQKGSHHAKAAQILGSLDNLLGEVIGGKPAVDAGCRQCHGSEVRIGPEGRPTPDTWPNTGMGRINPDGSWGSCSACHARHEFSVAQGPDSPKPAASATSVPTSRRWKSGKSRSTAFSTALTARS